MKITIDTKTMTCKFKGKNFDDLSDYEKEQAVGYMRHFIYKTRMSDFEETMMWMSLRYAIGRHSIASVSHAGEIGKACYGRMSDERSVFTAYDINREIEDKLRFSMGPHFSFPITSYNKIYTTAIDIFCEFIEKHHITTRKQLMEYKDIHVETAPAAPGGYSLWSRTWDEHEKLETERICMKYGITGIDDWDDVDLDTLPEAKAEFEKLRKYIKDNKHDESYISMMNFEDLFPWNDLCHLFDLEHHHESILTDGTRCRWFWTWTRDYRQDDNGQNLEIAYRKIRVPVDRWTGGSVTVWLPDDSIKEDIF